MSTKRKRRAAGRARRAAAARAPAAAPQAPVVEAAGVRELARLLHKAASTVSSWTSRPDWPFGPPPWPVESVRGWASIALSPDPAAAMHDRLAQAERAAAAGGDATSAVAVYQQRARAELLQIVARTRLLVQQHDRTSGKLHDAETCQARKTQQIHAVKESFLGLARTVAPRLVGQGKDEIERLLLAEIAAVCNSFAAGSGVEQSGRGAPEAGSSGAAAAPPARGRHEAAQL